MKKKKIYINKYVVIFAFIALILSMLIPITYAYFTATVVGNNTASVSVVESGTMRLTFSDGQVIGTTTNWVPGDSITKTFTVENTGTLPTNYSVFLEDVVNSFVDKSDLVYTISGTTSGTSSAYSTTSQVEVPESDVKLINNQAINSGDIHTYTLTITFLNKNENQDDNQSKTFSGKLQVYDTHNEPSMLSFATMSWPDIIAAYNSGDSTQLEADMEAGITRDVDLGSLGVHKVRIANLTPCSEVDVISKSACGLVIEFADIISEHVMNSTNTNVGGWQYSDLRAYVNSNIYAAENIDYSSTGIYSNMPSDLKPLIISTSVVSGHGKDDSANFITDDYMYLLSRREILNYQGSDDTASQTDETTNKDYTRQLDYYNAKGVTTSNYSGAIKYNDGWESYWWIRSAYPHNNERFYIVSPMGDNLISYSSYINGVSPAFRLAN